MYTIIQIEPGDGARGTKLDAETTRTVRLHAMHHVRRKQRDARNSGKSTREVSSCGTVAEGIAHVLGKLTRHPLLPAPIPNGRVDDKEPVGSDEHHDDHDDTENANTEPSSAISKATSKPATSSAPHHTGTEIPRLSHGATFYRYLLAELFGASLIGSGPQRPRSPGIQHYRAFVASTKSDLVLATDDSLCLLLPACAMRDRRILFESRQRHLAGIRFMQAAIEGRAKDVLVLIAGALEILFLDIFAPVSVGSGSLYDGLVHLMREHWGQLVSFRWPVPLTRFLLAQLEQVMLMESLVRRTAMPIEVEAWRELPPAAGLVHEMTESLMGLAICVPGLVQRRGEALQAESQDVAELERALQATVSLETRFIQWQKEWSLESLDVFRLSDDLHCEEASRERMTGHDREKLRKLPFMRAQSLALCDVCILLLQEKAAELNSALKDSALTDTYTDRATWTANKLCDLSECFMQEEDGFLSKAMSAYAPLYFARLWYEKSDDNEREAAAKEQETRLKDEVPFISWPSILAFNFIALYMHG